MSKPDDVKLYSQQGVYLGIGHRYDRMRGSHSSMGSETVKHAYKPLLDWPYIVSLLSFHEQSHEQARQDGIVYKSVMEHDRPTLPQLGQLFGHCMDYIEHFKLRSQPFSEHAVRESLWNDARMEEGLSRLDHLVQNGLLGLVTGASGLGTYWVEHRI